MPNMMSVIDPSTMNIAEIDIETDEGILLFLNVHVAVVCGKLKQDNLPLWMNYLVCFAPHLCIWYEEKPRWFENDWILPRYGMREIDNYVSRIVNGSYVHHNLYGFDEKRERIIIIKE